MEKESTTNPQQMLMITAIKRAKEGFPSPKYPGLFIDKETKVAIAIKKSFFIKETEVLTDEASVQLEKSGLIISVDLFKAPEHLVSLLEKKDGVGEFSGQTQDPWKTRKNYRFEYEMTVDKTYADIVVTNPIVRND